MDGIFFRDWRGAQQPASTFSLLFRKWQLIGRVVSLPRQKVILYQERLRMERKKMGVVVGTVDRDCWVLLGRISISRPACSSSNLDLASDLTGTYTRTIT